MTTYPNDQSNPAGALPSYSAFNYTQVSASGSIKATPGYFGGFICTASSAGVVTVWDNTAGSGTALYTGTLTAGQVVSLNNAVYAKTGLYFTLVSGTATVNVIWR